MLKRITTIAVIAAVTNAAWASLEVFPRICRANRPVDLTIRLSEAPGVPAEDLRVLYIRADGARLNGTQSSDTRKFDILTPEYNAEKQTLTIKGITLKGEAMHTLRLVVNDPKVDVLTSWKNLGKMQLYTLEDDLFALRPYRGDFHAHSKGSDGTGTSFSVYAYGRRAGNDFQALSDHYTYKPTPPAAKMVEELNSGMLPIIAEEIHEGATPLHSVSVGASAGVCDWVKENNSEFQKLAEAKKAKIAPELKDRNLTEYELNAVAKAETMYDIARKLGAKLVIYSHPYWMPNDRYNAPSDYNLAMIDRQKADAVECPNGPFPDQAMKVYADIVRLAKQGKTLNVVGATDTHDAKGEIFIDRETIVFAPKLTVDSICESIKKGNSLAVVGKYGKEQEEVPMFIGDGRLVNFCYFLGKNYFPERTLLCKEQGELMLKALDENDKSEATLKGITDLRDKIATFDAEVWAK